MSSQRYSVFSVEGQFEPGSRRRVLRNRLGIRRAREMAFHESQALLGLTEQLITEISGDQRFTAEDLRSWHRRWLGSVYTWAGEYRQVNLFKAGFPFAAAERVPSLMEVFEREQLRQLTPLSATRLDEQVRALAVVHAEFVLIHPFREGNGRCARLLAVLMALQAGLPPLDFEGIRGAERKRYIAGVHAAMGRDYEPLAEVFRRVTGRTLVGGRKRRRWLDD